MVVIVVVEVVVVVVVVVVAIVIAAAAAVVVVVDQWKQKPVFMLSSLDEALSTAFVGRGSRILGSIRGNLLMCATLIVCCAPYVIRRLPSQSLSKGLLSKVWCRAIYMGEKAKRHSWVPPPRHSTGRCASAWRGVNKGCLSIKN